MQYKLNYIELPLTIAREKGRRGAGVQFHYGLNIRLQFLVNSEATVTPAYTSTINTSPDINAVQKVYAEEAKSFVIGI